MTITVIEPQPGPGDEVTRLLIGWLMGQESVHTRIAYARDVAPWLIPRFQDESKKRGRPRALAVPAWIDWCNETGADPVDGITRSHVNAYARLMQSAGLSPTTRSRKLSAVSSWYQWLCQEDRIPVNPAKDATRPKVDRHTSKTPGLTEAQAMALLATADAERGPQHLRNAALLAVLLFTAARVSEVTDAEVEDLGVDRGHRVLWVTRKGGKQQPLPLPPAASARLDAYLASRADVETVPAVPSEPGVPRPRRILFATITGKRMFWPEVRDLIRRLAKAAGFPEDLISRLGAHAMRHTAITIALANGAPLHEVQDWAGHASADTTQRYNHARQRLDRSPAYIVARAMAEGGDQ